MSVRTPIYSRMDPRLYSKRNWVGLNPFTFVSGVKVRCESGRRNVVKINIQVEQFRTFMWVAFWFTCSGLAAIGMPKPEDVILFIAVTTVVAWFGLVWFLGGFLIQKEIRNCLDAGKA